MITACLCRAADPDLFLIAAVSHCSWSALICGSLLVLFFAADMFCVV